MQTRIRILFIASVLFCQSVQAAAESAGCARGEAALANADLAGAAQWSTVCLAQADLSDAAKRRALQLRAWAFFNLNQDKAAVLDQENSFKLGAPREIAEFVNYSSYLRRVARYQDSLNALRSAEKLERAAGKPGMMIQYNLGWTLFELGRYEGAVQVLGAAIPSQPDFPFAYWRRALALEAMGRKAQARLDIEKAADLVVNGPMKFTDDKFMAALRSKVAEYGLAKKYAF
ncbi:MAG TPA: tetratricopeptide repeat protein [Telluria sp.]